MTLVTAGWFMSFPPSERPQHIYWPEANTTDQNNKLCLEHITIPRLHTVTTTHNHKHKTQNTTQNTKHNHNHNNNHSDECEANGMEWNKQGTTDGMEWNKQGTTDRGRKREIREKEKDERIRKQEQEQEGRMGME